MNRRTWLRCSAGGLVWLSARAAFADDREISGILELAPEEIDGWPIERQISGDGHTHSVHVSSAELAQLLRDARVVVRSGPGGENEHLHWIDVRLR